jgi:hypothetical protein
MLRPGCGALLMLRVKSYINHHLTRTHPFLNVRDVAGVSV